MRLIDADALKEAMYLNGACGICLRYVDDADTLNAIPVEWLRKWPKDLREGAYVRDILTDWQKEQEAR